MMGPYGLRDPYCHADQSKLGTMRAEKPWEGYCAPKMYQSDDGLFYAVQWRLNPLTGEFWYDNIYCPLAADFSKNHFSWMQMVTGFEPLFDRLVYIRHLSLVRPAIPVAVDPIKCWVAFYFTLDKEKTIVYSTDQKPDYRPKLTGNIQLSVELIC